MIKITNNKVRWAVSAVLALLLLFGTYRNVFSLAAFLGCGLMIFFFDKESTLLQLFFIMPMANIFKLSPGTQSFFTILILLYVVLHLVLPRRATMLAVLFGVYVVVGELLAGQFELFKTIKLICNLLFLSSILNGKVEIRHREIFMSYIVGNLVASVFGTMNSSFFKIESYTGVEAYGNPNAEEMVTRFIGLYTDPNYYAVGIIISLCLIVVLFHRNEIKPLSALILAVPLTYFLILTYSKSALVMLLVLLSFFVYSFHRKRNFFAVIALILSALVVVCLAISGRIPALEVIIERFSVSDTSDGVDINSLTTGRLDIWKLYIRQLLHNFRVAIFGCGIASDYVEGHASHNTYIESVYHLGAVGSSLLVTLLAVISRQSRKAALKRNFLNYSVMICVVTMYFFLSELFYFDPPFHIFLAFTVLNLPNKENFSDNKIKDTEMVTENEYVRIRKNEIRSD